MLLIVDNSELDVQGTTLKEGCSLYSSSRTWDLFPEKESQVVKFTKQLGLPSECTYIQKMMTRFVIPACTNLGTCYIVPLGRIYIEGNSLAFSLICRLSICLILTLPCLSNQYKLIPIWKMLPKGKGGKGRDYDFGMWKLNFKSWGWLLLPSLSLLQELISNKGFSEQREIKNITSWEGNDSFSKSPWGLFLEKM